MSGFEAPNHTQAPNAFFDKILPEIDTVTELKVTLCVMRQTLGWHKEEDVLSLSRIQALTGLRREGVVDGLRRAMRRGTVTRREAGNTFAYRLKVVGKPDQSAERGGRQTGPETVGKPDPQKKRKESTSKERSSLSGGGQKKAAPPADEGKARPVSAKQYGVARLVEARNAAKGAGKNPLPLDEPFKRRFGDVYAAHLADGWEAEELEAPLDLMVRCACGEGPEGLTYGRGRARWVPLVDALAHLHETGQPVSLEDRRFERERQRVAEEREKEREAELRALGL